MAQVRGRLPSTSTTQKPRQRERRVLLPSNRVAVFRLPRVGEFLEIRDDAMIKATEKFASPTDAAVGIELGKLLLRRMLCGLTVQPVDLVFPTGFRLETVRAKAEAESAELVAEGKLALDVEGIVWAEQERMLDLEATKAKASPQPVTDIAWEEGDGPVGQYLRAIQDAEMDTLEAYDWRGLKDFATMGLPHIVKETDGPKGQNPLRIRGTQ